MIFLQVSIIKTWDIVGKNTCAFVRKMCLDPTAIENANFTDMCLIPKVPHLEFVNYFRSVSLCNTLYKIIRQVVAW